MRAAVVLLALLATSAASDFYLCEVVVPNFCATPIDLKRQATCMSDPSLTLQGQSYDITTGYNVIAFGTLNANADTEGRMLVGGNAALMTGYSIGEKVYTKGPGAIDTKYPYAGVFGGNLNWPSGSINPAGDDYYSAAYTEYMYVAGSFTGADDLAARRTTNTEAISGDMAAAQSFYTQVQGALDALTDNMQVAVQYGTMTFTCPAGASTYSVHVPSATFAGVTTYAFDGCSSSVQMIITIPADSTQVSFTSGAIDPATRDISRTVFNIMGSGRTIKFTSTRFYGIILAPMNNYAVDANAPGATDGIVIVNNVQSAGQFNRINCTRPSVPAEPTPCVGFEAVCAGTAFTAPSSSIVGDTRDYNVISFGDFVANTGDIEGRLMVRDDFTVGNGYSIGYMLQTANSLGDRQEAYSLLAGGDCTWGQGSIHPDGSNIPYAGAQENIFCGSSFTGPEELTSRNKGGCAVSGCLDSIFDAAFTCYAGYSATLAAKTANVQVAVEYSNMMFTCSSATATEYVVNVQANLFPQATYYTTSNCNYQAYWTINVIGSGDLYLSGDSMVAPPGAVVYNVIGERNILVSGTAVNGHILAPLATLNQTGGVILGKVVVADVVMSLQINREDVCTEITNVPTPVIPTDDTPTTPQDCICTPNSGMPITLAAQFTGDGIDSTVTGVTSEGCPCFTPAIMPITLVANNKIGSIAVPSNAGGKAPVVNPSSNSASVAAASVAILAVALLF